MKAQLRKKYLMRKYFYKWINYVLWKREQRPDEYHQSSFNVDRKLRPYVESLKDMPKLTEQGKQIKKYIYEPLSKFKYLLIEHMCA